MYNLDEGINRFRFASRELYNNFFRASYEEDYELWCLMKDGFQEVQKTLFERMIEIPFGLDHYSYGMEAQLNVEVKVDQESMSVMLNRGINTGYWDYPLTKIPGEYILVFREFFDFNTNVYLDHGYTKVEVLKSSDYPDIVGKHGLIETIDAFFKYRDTKNL